MKSNYLGGSALILVEKETDYSKIWKRLLETFGNARLLLQNKLGALDKIGGLWKIKWNAKLTNTLAGLINTMTDLSSLASEHKIEGQLYEGGGLKKSSFSSEIEGIKNCEVKICVSRIVKDEWGKRLLFLKEELLLLEKLAFDNKTAQLMGLNPNTSETSRYNLGKEDRFMKGTEVNHAKTNESPACHMR